MVVVVRLFRQRQRQGLFVVVVSFVEVVSAVSVAHIIDVLRDHPVSMLADSRAPTVKLLKKMKKMKSMV